mgnify:CR=1 FL=1
MFNILAKKQRKDRMFFKSLPWKSYLIFLAAIFFLFSILGFVSSLMAMGRSSYQMILVNCLISGLTGALYAHSFIRDLRFLVLPVILQFGLIFYNSMYTPGEVTHLNEPGYFQFHALGILFLMVLGYVLFVVFINGEGYKQLQIKTEIDLAKKLHDILVPEVSLVTNGFEIFTFAKPVGDVGGDLSDVFINRNGASVITVADVSGHGVSAGLLMGMFKSALRSNLQRGSSLSDSFRYVNSTIYDLKEKRMFITASSLMINETGCCFSIAGHLPMLHFKAATNEVVEENIKQIALGVRKEFEFKEGTIAPEKGDIILLLTDGLTETFSKKKEMFGMDRVKHLLSENSMLGSEALSKKIIEEVEKFGQPGDDLTLVTVKRV